MFREEYETETNIYEPLFPPWLKEIPQDLYEKLEDGQIPNSFLDEIVEQAFSKIAKKFDSYQSREEQIKMAKMVLRSFYSDKSALVEAGTGIGKSFAYLVAAIAFSYLTGERVALSTETKNLQLQLFEKDIPFLQNVLSPKLSYSLCLGSNNYLCQLRYQESIDTGILKDQISNEEYNMLRAWAHEAFDGKHEGNQFDLPFQAHGMGNSFWSSINRDSDGCPANKCAFFSSCNYYRTRKQWAESRIVVANHHLLLLHFLNDKKTLPPYGAVILDEAHGILKTGYAIFALSFSQNVVSDMKKQYDRAVRSIQTGQEFFDETEAQWNNLLGKWTDFFSQWEMTLDLFGKEEGTQVIENKVNIPIADMGTLTEELKAKVSGLLEDEEDSTVQNYLRGVYKFFDRLLRFIQHFSSVNTDKFVFWGEKKKNVLHLHSCNLQLGEEFSNFFSEPQLWTSATLGFWDKPFPPKSTQEKLSMGYFKNFVQDVLPQSEKEIVQNIFYSPFRFDKQALLYIPRGLAIPPYSSSKSVVEDYEQKLAEEIAWLSELSGGGSMALFTSNYRLRNIAELLEDISDLEIISQLEYGPNMALELFRKNPKSILLGSASFWQGVDIAGDQLRMVIITQMMFSPPDEPIFKARSNKLQKQNRNSFFELSVPNAGTMLRQAFGRLIRTESDRGVVALLDSRLLEKSYGKTFVANLPPMARVHDRNSLVRETNTREIF